MQMIQPVGVTLGYIDPGSCVITPNLADLLDLEHGCPPDRIVFEGIQGAVGFAEWENLDFCVDGDLSGNLEEVVAVAPRIIRDVADHSLMVEEVVIERRYGAHVDSTERERSAFL